MRPLHCRVLALMFAYLVTTNCWGQLDTELSEGFVTEEVDVSPWTGSVAAGLSGKSGNSQNLDINMSLNLARETETANTTLLASYFYSANDTATVTDRFIGQARRERKLRNPRWSIYYQFGYEYDRFKAFDYRISLHAGFSFEVYKFDDRFLKLRFGSGASKEVGGIPGDWIPELQFGADWERQLTDTVKLFANVDYFPNVSDFADYRINTNAGLEFVVDAPRNINFRMFTLNRFDNTPLAGNVKNDIDYGLALVVGF